MAPPLDEDFFEEVEGFEDADLDALRMQRVGYVFTGTPMSKRHSQFLNMNKEKRAVLRARMDFTRQASFSPAPTGYEQESTGHEATFSFTPQEVVKISRKWCWVQARNGAFGLMQVIEDTASTDNFISAAMIDQLGLERKPAELVGQTTMTGQIFAVHEYVEVSWRSRGSQGVVRCYVVPHGAPIQMLVGAKFIRQYPDVFMDEEPQGKDALLTLQTRLKSEPRPPRIICVTPHRHKASSVSICAGRPKKGEILLGPDQALGATPPKVRLLAKSPHREPQEASRPRVWVIVVPTPTLPPFPDLLQPAANTERPSSSGKSSWTTQKVGYNTSLLPPAGRITECPAPIEDAPLPASKWATICDTKKADLAVLTLLDHESPCNWALERLVGDADITTLFEPKVYSDARGNHLQSNRMAKLTWTGSGVKTFRNEFYIVSETPSAHELIMGKSLLQQHGEQAFLDKKPSGGATDLPVPFVLKRA
ncbi:hypothetical protein GQ53DRAFT_806447 [Thozetella sp. PMI_491]|nr:hypothetical protein GQ53DRAFT_806447 [Thozetella sp. PMI_491]